MQRSSVPRPSSQAPERAPGGDEIAVRDDALRGQPNAVRGSRVVMIVDDHVHFRSALRDWIAREDAGYELIEAASGEEAIALAGSRKVHLALMDIELTGMNGLEATRRIREMYPEIAVIVVSQHTGDAYVEQARAAGAFAYITKDRVNRELLPAVGRALGRAPSGGGHGDVNE